MQLKSRYVLTALAALVVMTMATTAMAQVTLQVSSTPTARARAHGHAELIGDVTFTVLDQTMAGVVPILGTHTVTIDYRIPVTNDETETASPESVQILGTGCFNDGDLGAGVADGLFSSVEDNVADPDAAWNYVAGTVTLTLIGDGVTSCAAGDTVTVRNVHASVVGLADGVHQAQVSTSPTGGYLIQAAQDQPTVIARVLDELDGGVSTIGACLFLSDGTEISNNRSLRVLENFADAILDATQLGGGAQNDVQVRLTFVGIPTGASVSVAAEDITISPGDPANVLGWVNAAGLVATSVSPTMTITIDGDLPSAILNDTLQIPFDVSYGGAAIPLTPGDITVIADIVPLGTETKITPAPGNFPRFASDPEPEVVVCTVVPAQTNLLVPFMTAGGGFDTGIAIANTTADNFGVNGAVDQDGGILFEFWPQSGTPFTYTTSAASPGSGLDAGIVNSGGSYVVLLSELLADAGAPADFTGYMIVTADFTNGHGDVFISDFSGFTSAGNVLVMDPPVAGNSRNPAPFAEGLDK